MQPNNNNNGIPHPPLWKRWLRYLSITLAGLVLLVVALLTWLNFDSARTRSILETVVSNLTDRPFHIRGDFNLSLGREVDVTATDIEWVNAPWSSQPTMLTVESAEASIDLFSLFSPPILISRAVASNARLDFEWNDAGKSNWYLVKPGKPPRTEPLHPLPLLLGEAEISNIELHFDHPALTEKLTILITNGTQQQDANNNLVADIDTVIKEREIGLDGLIGPFPELVIAGAIVYDFAVRGPNAEIDLKGNIDRLRGFRGPDFVFSIKAPEITDFLDLLNLPAFTNGELDLAGKLESEGEAIKASVGGVMGDFNLDAGMEADSLKSLDGLQLKVESDGPSVAALGEFMGLQGLPDASYRLKVDARDASDGLRINSATFSTDGTAIDANGLIHDFPSLTNIDFDASVDIDSISRYQALLPGDNVPDLPLTATLRMRSDQQGDTDKLNVDAKLGSGTITVDGRLTEEPQMANSRLDFSARLPNAQNLARVLKVPLLQAAELQASGSATLSSTGIRIDRSAGSLGNTAFTAAGDIPFREQPLRIELNATATSDSLAATTAYFTPSDQVPALPFEAATTLIYSAPKITFRSASGALDKNNFKGDGNILLGGGLPDISVNVTVDGPDLSQLPAEYGLEGWSAERYSLQGLFNLSRNGIRLENIDFRTSDDRLGGTFVINWPEHPEQIGFDISGSGANLQSIAPDIPGYEPAAKPFEIAARGRIDGETISVPELTARIGSAKFNVGGTLQLKPELSATGVTLQATGPNMQELGQIEGWPFREIPFEVSASLQGSNDRVAMNDLDIVTGPSDIQGKFSLDASGEKPEININLTSQTLDIRPLQQRLQSEDAATSGEVPVETAENEQSTAPGEPETADEFLIPDTPLAIEMLNAYNVDVAIDIKTLVSRRFDLGELKLDGKLQDGDLEISRFAARTDRGRVDATMELTQGDASSRLHADLEAKNLVLAFGELDDYMRQNHPGQDVNLNLTGTGNSLREIAASLDGYLWLRGGERKIKANSLGLIMGDFLSEVFNTINPFAQQEEYETLQCDRVFFEATDGVLQTAPIVLLRSDKLNIVANGTVDLNTEKIDIGIETTPIKGIGISASDLVNPFIKIGGSLSKPRMVLDPAGTIVEGSAAVATMGMTILAKSLYKRWIGSRNACEKFTEKAFEIRKERDPSNVPAD